MRSPLYDTLRRFCLGAFALYHQDMDKGADLPFAFEEHGSYGRPTLYEYRPLVRGYVEARADRLYQRDDVRSAVADLQREPAARIFARAHEGHSATRVARSFAACSCRCSCAPPRVAAASTGTTAHRPRIRRARGSLFGEGHAYGAVAPLVGISCGTVIELGDGIRVRATAAGELAAMSRRPPTAPARVRPRPTGCACSSSSARLRRAPTRFRTRRASSPTRSPRSVSPRRRLVAAGPVLFERLDWRPYGIRPVLPIAATAPPGEPTRLDPFRATVVAQLRPCLAVADDDPLLGDALDRWELALFQGDPFRAEQLRHALDSALGDGQGQWAAGMRGAALLGDTPEERADLAARFEEPTTELMRRLLVELLLHGDRRRLLRELHAALLALRPPPARVAELRAS